MIRMVPVTQCDYNHGDKALNYFVYGLDCKVHAPTYPDQCWWGCTILWFEWTAVFWISAI